MDVKMKARVIRFVIAGIAASVVPICFLSRPIVYYELEFANAHHLSILEGVLLDMAEYRFGDDSKFQSAVGQVRYARSEEELSRSMEMLNRVLDSNVDADLRVEPLLVRAKIREQCGKLNEALLDVMEAKTIVAQQESKGNHVMNRSGEMLDKWIIHLQKKLNQSN